MYNAHNVFDLLSMEKYEEIINIFGSVKEFKKASKIFWSYRVSPLFTGEVAVKPEEFPYYFLYKNYITREKFYVARETHQ